VLLDTIVKLAHGWKADGPEVAHALNRVPGYTGSVCILADDFMPATRL